MQVYKVVRARVLVDVEDVDDLITINRAAELAKMLPSTMSRMIDKGTFPEMFTTDPAPRRYTSRKAIEEYLDNDARVIERNKKKKT